MLMSGQSSGFSGSERPVFGSGLPELGSTMSVLGLRFKNPDETISHFAEKIAERAPDQTQLLSSALAANPTAFVGGSAPLGFKGPALTSEDSGTSTPAAQGDSDTSEMTMAAWYAKGRSGDQSPEGHNPQHMMPELFQFDNPSLQNILGLAA